MNYTLKKIAPLPLGKILALIYGLFSLLLIPFFGATLLITLSSGAKIPQIAEIIFIGIFAIIFIPVMYAVMGFLTGVVSAWIYNVAAGWIGGLTLEVDRTVPTTKE